MSLGDYLKHYGVKGMRWGIRRYQPYPKGSKHKGKFIGDRVKSKKREISTLNKARNKNLDKQSTTAIKQQSRRQALENKYQRLSNSSKVGTSKDREQYRRRDKMSDEELRRKVDRLSAKEEYKNLALEANKTTLDKGKKVATGFLKVAVPVAAGYASSKIKSQHVRQILKNAKVRPGDIDRMLNVILK